MEFSVEGQTQKSLTKGTDGIHVFISGVNTLGDTIYSGSHSDEAVFFAGWHLFPMYLMNTLLPRPDREKSWLHMSPNNFHGFASLGLVRREASRYQPPELSWGQTMDPWGTVERSKCLL